MRIGFAGLGRMGRRMAANCAAGHDITVWNRRPEPADSFVREFGSKRAVNPMDLSANTDIVITMLADDQAARNVYLGEDGILAGHRADLVVEMGTLSPAMVDEIAEAAKAQGKTFVDAPVSGATQAAETASLLIMAGAPDDLADRLGPVFDLMGKRTVWLGRTGAGAAMKLAVNTLIHGLNQTLAEALTLAEGAGIDPATAFDVIENSAAAAPMLKYRRSLYLDEAAQEVSFTIELARKDVRLALQLASATNVDMPQTRATYDVLEAAGESNYDGRDMAAIVNFMREKLK
jgi:3-hydroxyisobutyrate dehydrogenase